MSFYDDDGSDSDGGGAALVRIPTASVECVPQLMQKLERHAVALFTAATDGDEDVTVTFSREGMIEVSTAIFQLLATHKARKYVS